MSSKKTEFINLHKWESSDRVSLQEFNENFDKIDEYLGDYKEYKSGKDSEGIFTVVEYKRADGTLYRKQVLSGGTSPLYTTFIITWYDRDGITVVKTVTRTLSYDADGDLISAE